MVQSPIASDAAISPDVTSCWLAPTAVSPATTMAKEEENPTNPDSSPAAVACGDNAISILSASVARIVDRNNNFATP